MRSVTNLASFLFAVGAVWEVTEKDSGPGNSTGNIVLVEKLGQTPLLLLCLVMRERGVCHGKGLESMCAASEIFQCYYFLEHIPQAVAGTVCVRTRWELLLFLVALNFFSMFVLQLITRGVTCPVLRKLISPGSLHSLDWNGLEWNIGKYSTARAVVRENDSS